MRSGAAATEAMQTVKQGVVMADRNDGFYVMAFHSVNHSIQTEKKANELFKLTVIPTPRELTNDCGIAIKFHDCDIAAIEAFFKTLTVPADVYFLSDEKINGRRSSEKVL